jgi:hypothetical protein
MDTFVQARARLERRLVEPPGNVATAVTDLAHFALITYGVPRARLAAHIPAARYDLPEFAIDGQRLCLMSAVPFVDEDFHFPHFFPFVKLRFGQTNYRVYVIDRATGEHAVWFFGTTLGSPVVHIPRVLWRIPWHPARHTADCVYDPGARRYTRFRHTVDAPWATARVALADSGAPPGLLPGFADEDAQTLILTNPVDGYFYRLDGRLGTYSVWHPLIALTRAEPRELYFSLFERLGLLTREEMQRPHSALVCRRTRFKILLPPRRL